MDIHGVCQCFEKRYGKSYRIFSAPGRINLIGEHTDYSDGFVFPGAIDMAVNLAINPTQTSIVRLYAIDLNEEVEFDLVDKEISLPSWACYPYGVVQELQKMCGEVTGFDAVFGGNIPLGAGLSSSAALESAFAFALNETNQLGLSKEKLARIGQLSEHNYVGVKCGIMDQFASLFGKENQFIRLDCRDLSYEMVPFIPNGYTLLLADTGVKHSLASSEYNTRRMQCEEGVKIISRQFSSVVNLRDVNLDMLKEVRSLLNPIVYNRCVYVVEENLRVMETTEALEANDISRLGQLIYSSHAGLSSKYEVSCIELDTLVEVAKESSYIAGARMMGGGFGGCTLNLIEENAIEEFKERANLSFNKTFGRNPKYIKVSISEGAREIK